MKLQHILAAAMLIYGVGYGCLLLWKVWKNWKQVSHERGAFWQLSICEAVVFFFTTMGFPDFVLNTLAFRKCGWVDDKRLPGTLVVCSVLPGAIIAFVYLWGKDAIDMTTMLLCIAAIAFGSFTGARVVSKLDGKTIRLIMGVTMLFSMAALVLKLILTAGAVGTANGLTALQLCIALPLIFCFGFINMFGVPLKPPAIAMFLLMGLSPMNTLILVLAMAVVSPMAGGIQVLRSGLYHGKIALAAISFGVVGALLGTAFTVTLDATMLTVILLVIMAITVVSVLKPEKKRTAV